MEVRPSVCIFLVILLVLVSGGLGATNLANSLRLANADAAKKSKSFANLKGFFDCYHSCLRKLNVVEFLRLAAATGSVLRFSGQESLLRHADAWQASTRNII